MLQILFIGLNDDQVPYLNALKKLGYYIIGIDKNRFAPGVGLVDLYINHGYDEYLEIEHVISCNADLKPNAVFTASAQFSHVLASRLAKLYDLPYPSERLVETILDKTKFYNFFSVHGLPIPNTSYVASQNELDQFLENSPEEQRYYIKSDYSKNPNYVYSGTAKSLLETQINWDKDTYLRSCYVVQPEIVGPSLRINIMGAESEVYDFNSGLELLLLDQNVSKIVTQLRTFCETVGLVGWVVKFDVIDTQNSFATLDIGIDPPSRMRRKFICKGQDFEKYYLEKYLDAFE